MGKLSVWELCWLVFCKDDPQGQHWQKMDRISLKSSTLWSCHAYYCHLSHRRSTFAWAHVQRSQLFLESPHFGSGLLLLLCTQSSRKTIMEATWTPLKLVTVKQESPKCKALQMWAFALWSSVFLVLCRHKLGRRKYSSSVHVTNMILFLFSDLLVLTAT